MRWRLWRRGVRFQRHGEAVAAARGSARPTAASRHGGGPRERRHAAPARRAAHAIARSTRSRSAPGSPPRRGSRVGCLTVVLPDGRRRVFGDPASERRAEIRVHDEAAALRMLLHGEIGLGEAYMDGLWSSPGPRGADRARGPQPLGARVHEEAGGGCRSRSRACSRTGPGATRRTRPARTSRPTTTWATTSTGCSWTRR